VGKEVEGVTEAVLATKHLGRQLQKGGRGKKGSKEGEKNPNDLKEKR